MDGNGKLPHQRDGVEYIGVDPNSDVAALLHAFFNRGFRPRVNDRFESVEDLLKQVQLIKDCSNRQMDSISAAAARNSELLRLHDRTVQLVKIKQRLPKLHQQMEAAIGKLLKAEKLDLFEIKQRQEDVSNHSANSSLKLEWIHSSVIVRQLRVPPHQFIREIGYGLAVSGDELIVLRYKRESNPGKLSGPDEISRVPLMDDLELTPITQDFKTWMVRSMDELRSQILPSLSAISS